MKKKYENKITNEGILTVLIIIIAIIAMIIYPVYGKYILLAAIIVFFAIGLRSNVSYSAGNLQHVGIITYDHCKNCENSENCSRKNNTTTKEAKGEMHKQNRR